VFLGPSPFKAKTVSFRAFVFYDDVLNNSWKMTMGYSAGKAIATKPEKIRQKDAILVKRNPGESKGGEPN
jgi:hypothetical protein